MTTRAVRTALEIADRTLLVPIGAGYWVAADVSMLRDELANLSRRKFRVEHLRTITIGNCERRGWLRPVDAPEDWVPQKYKVVDAPHAITESGRLELRRMRLQAELQGLRKTMNDGRRT